MKYEMIIDSIANELYKKEKLNADQIEEWLVHDAERVAQEIRDRLFYDNDNFRGL